MRQIVEKKQFPTIVLAVIMMVGIGIRLYHLGLNGFWFDEIGVANVAYAENLLEILRISKSHVMAMPFDYIIAFLVSGINDSEFLMRIPSLMWGSFSILLLYFLAKYLSENQNIALFSAALMAITPIHIYYSQELRFYSALGFFILAGVFSLKKAIQYPTMKNWLVYHAILLIGCFFHVYVLFVLVLGGIWIVLLWFQKKLTAQVLGQFVITNLNILIIVFAGIYLLTSNQHTGTFYTDYFQVTITAITTGIAVLPLHLNQNGLIAGFVTVFMLFPFIVGWIFSVSGKADVWNRGIALFIPIATILVLVFDLVKAYFIQPRQFLFLLPFVIYMSASGIIKLFEFGLVKFPEKKSNLLIGLIIYCLIMIGINAVSLRHYHSHVKSYIREIVEQIELPANPENTIYISPPYDVGSFLYYYRKFEGEKYPGRLIGFEGSEIDQIKISPGDFIILDQSLDGVDTRILLAWGLEPVLITHPLQNRNDILWLLPDSPDS